MNLLSRIIRKVQANKNSKEINCASHVSNLGFQEIGVQKGRHTTLKFSLNMRNMEGRKKHNLKPKKRGMKQQKKKNPLPRQKNLQYFQVYLDFTPLGSRVAYKAKRLRS